MAFQPCGDAVRAPFALVDFLFCFFSNKRWDLKRETIQSSAAHLSKCLKTLLSTMLSCLLYYSSLYSCAHVQSLLRFFVCVCVCFGGVGSRTVFEWMPDSRFAVLFLCEPAVFHQESAFPDRPSCLQHGLFTAKHAGPNQTTPVSSISQL